MYTYNVLRKDIQEKKMSNLFILNETFTNGSNYALLNIISLASILCGILVIISKNPIVSVLFLIGLFITLIYLITLWIAHNIV